MSVIYFFTREIIAKSRKENDELSLRMILKKFLIFCNFEPRDSYKLDSYKKNSVMTHDRILPKQIF